MIDGQQPAIPENPTPEPQPSKPSQLPSPAEVNTGQVDRNRPILLSQLAKSVRKTEQVQIKTTTTHALSLEQQIFFKEITEAIVGNDEAKRIEALNCIQMDPGLQALVPRFSLAIVEGVSDCFAGISELA